ncbi:MAG: DUF421 domain-containing protein [Clostridia bacterium]|nr:DUF421 domain-containing protein [Clostridia bacterium]
MVSVLIRTLIIYFMLLFALRLTGKRQVGELQVSELITTFMISELAASPIQDLSIPLIYSVIPIVFLLCAEIILSFVTSRSKAVKKLFYGNPSFIIKGGVLDQGELMRLRISINDLLGELRLKDVGDISAVDYAILEQNGKLSVFLKEGIRETEVAHALVVDGVINETNLQLTKKDESWLMHQLNSRRIALRDVFLFTVTDNNIINIIKKEGK